MDGERNEEFVQADFDLLRDHVLENGGCLAGEGHGTEEDEGEEDAEQPTFECRHMGSSGEQCGAVFKSRLALVLHGYSKHGIASLPRAIAVCNRCH
eukprot:2471801-Amphidinium_carterae.1